MIAKIIYFAFLCAFAHFVTTVDASCFTSDAYWKDGVKPTVVQTSPTTVTVHWKDLVTKPRCVDKYIVKYKRVLDPESSMKTAEVGKDETSRTVAVEACVDYQFLVELVEEDKTHVDNRQSGSSLFRTRAVPQLVGRDPRNFHVDYFYDERRRAYDLERAVIMWKNDILMNPNCLDRIEVVAREIKKYFEPAAFVQMNRGAHLKGKPNNNGGLKPDYNGGQKPDYNDGQKPDYNNGQKPDYNDGQKPDFNNGRKPDYLPGGNSGQWGGSSGSGSSGSSSSGSSSEGSSEQWNGESNSGQWDGNGNSGQWNGNGNSGQWSSDSRSDSNSESREREGKDDWDESGEYRYGWGGNGQWGGNGHGSSGQWGGGYGGSGQWGGNYGGSGQWGGNSGQWGGNGNGGGGSGQWGGHGNYGHGPIKPYYRGRGRRESGQYPGDLSTTKVQVRPPFPENIAEAILRIKPCSNYTFSINLVTKSGNEIGGISGLYLPRISDIPNYTPPSLNQVFNVNAQRLGGAMQLRPDSPIPKECLADYFRSFDAAIRNGRQNLQNCYQGSFQEMKRHNETKKQLQKISTNLLNELKCECQSTKINFTTTDFQFMKRFQDFFDVYDFGGVHNDRPYYSKQSKGQTLFVFYDPSLGTWNIGKKLGKTENTFRSALKIRTKCPADSSNKNIWNYASSLGNWEHRKDLEFECIL